MCKNRSILTVIRADLEFLPGNAVCSIAMQYCVSRCNNSEGLLFNTTRPNKYHYNLEIDKIIFTQYGLCPTQHHLLSYKCVTNCIILQPAKKIFSLLNTIFKLILTVTLYNNVVTINYILSFR